MPILNPDMQIIDNTSDNSERNVAKFDLMKRKQKARLENKSTDRMYNDWKTDTEYKSRRKKLIRQLKPVTDTAKLRLKNVKKEN